MKDVCVVIPWYKEELNENELASYNRLLNTLSENDIAIVAPERLRACLKSDERISAFFLENERFTSRLSYSQMMLDTSFYEMFSDYEHILIYQLDAFVFSDRLMEFCNMGYDYIGAPLPKFEWFDLYHSLNIKENYSVGNGGFSLRRVESCIKVLERKQEIYDRTGLGNEFEQSEDEFWGYCGRSEDIDFTVPDIDVANRFATWGYEKELFNNYPDELPFGVHGWYTEPWKKVWLPFVNNTRPSHAEISVFNEYVLRRKIEYLVRHFIYNEDNGMTEFSKVFCSFIPCDRDIVLWGSGKYGKLIRNLLRIGNRTIKCIYDSNPRINEIDGVPVIKAIQSIIHKNELIVISSLFYEDSIEDRIKEVDGVGDDDYLMCSKLLRKAIESYRGLGIEEVYERI